MAVVEFDVSAFREAYPRFTKELLPDAQLELAFEVACLLLDNTESSNIPYDPARGIMKRATLLNLLVCHLATLALWPQGAAGPMASAAEGSVNISFNAPPQAGKAYYAQTPCGQTFWQAIQPYLMGGRYYAIGHAHKWS